MSTADSEMLRSLSTKLRAALIEILQKMIPLLGAYIDSQPFELAYSMFEILEQQEEDWIENKVDKLKIPNYPDSDLTLVRDQFPVAYQMIKEAVLNFLAQYRKHHGF